ncbi:hypothetical protein [Aurantiacibacter gilvus]|uniref:Secreted protein n=1 Tax=Aurantiacibacter gilvus TaxID=3139141 RepID=A0ABU9IAP0_9SPHN
MTKKLFTTVAATVALVATPVLAQSEVAQRAAAAAIDQAEGLGSDDDNGPGILLGALAAGLIIAGVVIAFGDSDDDLPASP